MNPVSTDRYRRSFKTGRMVEERYRRAVPQAIKSSARDDIHAHIDFWVDGAGVDVKGNNLPDEIWVEFKNVKGEPGWIFGEATFIAFDIPELGGFVQVEREELKLYCRDNVDYKDLVPKTKAYKKGYTRKDREDLITKLCLEDLETLLTFEVIPYALSYTHPQGDRHIRI